MNFKYLLSICLKIPFDPACLTIMSAVKVLKYATNPTAKLLPRDKKLVGARLFE